MTGWTVENVHWSGIRFRDLLAAARPLPEAHALRFVSAERPYTDSLTLQQAYLPQAMLATGMDGKPLTRDHGAPTRVVARARSCGRILGGTRVRPRCLGRALERP